MDFRRSRCCQFNYGGDGLFFGKTYRQVSHKSRELLMVDDASAAAFNRNSLGYYVRRRGRNCYFDFRRNLRRIIRRNGRQYSFTGFHNFSPHSEKRRVDRI